MNKDIISGKWKQLRGHFRMDWGRLTSSPFTEFSGQQDMLNGKIQEYRGRARIDRRKSEFLTQGR